MLQTGIHGKIKLFSSSRNPHQPLNEQAENHSMGKLKITAITNSYKTATSNQQV